jgi:zinc-ribbon domain
LVFCPNCGARVDGDAPFCSGCGRSLKSGHAVPDVNLLAIDSAAISRITVFGLLLIFAGIASVVVEILSLVGRVAPVGTVSLALTVVTTSMTVAGEIFLISGLRSLSRTDPSAFSIYSKLTMLLPFGSLTGILSSLYLVRVGATSTFPLVQLSGNLAQLLILVGITAAGGILVFVGWVGAVLGLWHMSARYHRDSLKLAALIYIVPYVNVVAGIILVTELGSLKRDRSHR